MDRLCFRGKKYWSQSKVNYAVITVITGCWCTCTHARALLEVTEEVETRSGFYSTKRIIFTHSEIWCNSSPVSFFSIFGNAALVFVLGKVLKDNRDMVLFAERTVFGWPYLNICKVKSFQIMPYKPLAVTRGEYDCSLLWVFICLQRLIVVFSLILRFGCFVSASRWIPFYDTQLLPAWISSRRAPSTEMLMCDVEFLLWVGLVLSLKSFLCLPGACWPSFHWKYRTCLGRQMLNMLVSCCRITGGDASSSILIHLRGQLILLVRVFGGVWL